MQDNLRALREQWKQTDQGGVPNHALWKRFDDACNEAYKVVQTWLDKVKSEAVEHKAQRLALIEEVKAWAADNTTARDDDWKGFNRILHQFSERWREAGHLSEKAFAELQPLWKETMGAAAAPLETIQKQSLASRQAMIEESSVLGAAPVLRIDAVKALQQRWQAEAHAIPLERRLEQKLWDAFRKPIDDAFNRKTADREKAATDLSERDRFVLEAAKALEAANAAGDAPKIRGAMNALDAALRGQALAQAAVQAESAATSAVASVNPAAESNQAPVLSEATQDAINDVANQALPEVEATEPAAPVAPPKAAPRPVVAVRGDDRPGMKKTEPMPVGRGGKFGDRKDSARGPRDARPGARADERGPRGDDHGDRGAWREAPRLGDVAFRAQREALEHAQLALKKLAAQAHGEALTQLLTAWEKRDASLMPSAQELDNRAAGAARSAWNQALGNAPGGRAGEALLRLEMAAELPTPAEHLDERRALQLQLLTRRNDPAPAQTWGQDVARVLACEFDARAARRLQNVLKVLLKR
jgi:ATP-dependent RNA helicase SUPV3L1/SUV3